MTPQKFTGVKVDPPAVAGPLARGFVVAQIFAMNAHKLLPAALLLALAPAANATLLISESFNYTGSASPGTSYLPTNAVTGTGLSGSWASSDSWVSVVTGNLSAPANSGAFAASNNRAVLSPGTTPSASASLASAISTVGNTVYFSFIGQVGSNGNDASTMGLRFTDSSNNTILGLGRTNTGEWGINTGSAFRSSTGNSAGTLGFVVYKVTFGAAGGANDRVDFFLNPGENGEVAATSSWSGLTLSDNSIGKIYLRAYGNANTQFDEIRVGTTWGDVAAVPEPSTYGLMGAGALASAMLVRRRRRVKA